MVTVGVPALAAVLEAEGLTPSITRAFEPAIELDSPMVANVKVALLPTRFRIVDPVPVGKVSEVVAL